MPLFYLSQGGWFGPRTFCIQNEDGDDVLSIESDSYWHDSFVARDAERDSQVARIQDSTASCGPYTYDIASSNSKRICATITDTTTCCSSECFELYVRDDDQTRTYYFDKTSLFSREYKLTRNGHVVATYSAAWLSPYEIDIEDQYVQGEKELNSIILFSCVAMERIHRRKAQRRASAAAAGHWGDFLGLPH